MATGINVTKANAYGVLVPPAGIGISKAVAYAVLSPPSAVPPMWGSWAFSSGAVGVAYSHSFDMPASAEPMTYTLVSGALPDGLSLVDGAVNTGTISGTPTSAGAFTFTLRATNAAGTVDKEFTITIGGAPAGGAKPYAWIA